MFTHYYERLKDDIRDNFFKEGSSEKKKKDDKSDEVAIQMMYCLQTTVRTHITVYNLNSHNTLSEAIFLCICRCKSIKFK